jgi:hypothetical protein
VLIDGVNPVSLSKFRPTVASVVWLEIVTDTEYNASEPSKLGVPNDIVPVVGSVKLDMDKPVTEAPNVTVHVRVIVPSLGFAAFVFIELIVVVCACPANEMKIVNMVMITVSGNLEICQLVVVFDSRLLLNEPLKRSCKNVFITYI